MKNVRYSIVLNYKAKTYTIRRFDGNKVTAKYRSYPQGSSFSDCWSEHDIINFLKYSSDYYLVR